ncbi:hypothetical protein JWH04_12080 [Xanthomonas melonis]|uniref:Uncharacterized protein n=1 Tax=Xanthomonas melonis TaxID=56456 RepID=A0A2S7DLW1_9XANT|nr:hypothetical protein [Xanthomonas melonis]MCC4598934.1 hypothetical protein [Xanthomonas melonis]MCD0246769.1 hypothetical protein [Xanthomonas melonis]MCD0279666.1 hypothetical protein [Xanthomonas melonis]PPU74836.1 hypothetical protein XmelCFBP4644_02715 [Xanthomonas melonis]
MAPKNTRNASGHDDVSGLFARLGTQAGEGYHDFAYPQLPPRKPGAAAPDAAPAAEAAPPAQEAVAPPAPVPPPVPAAAPGVPTWLAPHAAASAEQAASLPADALAPLRKLRQLDEPGPRGLTPPERPAQTPLERLFQRLLQADARGSAHSPLKRLRSR